MEKHSVKCRICWEEKERKICAIVTTKWTKDSLKTIKDVILFCVPWMSIKDDTYLCKPCLWKLKFTYDFIERCLKTENLLNEATNEKQLNLEDILENSLKNGNKIQIILENPINLQTDCAKDTSVNLSKSIQESKFNESVQESGVNFDESVQERHDDVETINVKIHSPEPILPLEHDYCIKKGTQIDGNVRNKQQSNITSNNTTEIKLSDNMPKKENIIVINDNLNDNDTDFLNDSITECNAEKNIVNPGTDILQNLLTTDTPKISYPQQATLGQELKDMLDITAADVWFLSVNSEMSAEVQNDFVRDGVNLLNMSKDPNKKKRTIFLSRELYTSHRTCSKCNTWFISSCDYMDHIRLHRRGKIKTPGVPIFTCKVCSETFALEIDFQGHSKLHHGIVSPHECPKCKRKFKFYRSLKAHIKNFKNNEKCAYNCARCNKEFYSLSSLMQHEKDVKDAPCCNYHKCRVCFEKFTKEGFKTHCKEVHSNYLCSECGKSFPSSGSLSKHVRNVHKAESCMCHECGKILSLPRYLEHHIQSVHGEKRYICDKCPRQFTTQIYLRKHLKTHLERAKYQTLNARRRFCCDKCEKSYTSRDSLRQHEKDFHSEVKQYVCTICNEGFIRNDYLKRHMIYHQKTGSISCPVCRRSFGTDRRLECHIAAGHDENGKSLEIGIHKLPTVTKKYKKASLKCVCKICGQVLANSANLRIHYKAHLSLRQAKCDICNIIFQGSLALKNHKKLHADPNFKFSCNICHAYKASSTELENHMLEVHKEKKYKCRLCPEAFGRKHLLYSHEAIVHKEEVFKKEALFEMLQEDQIFLPPNPDDHLEETKGRQRRIRRGKLEVDVDTVFDKILNEKIEMNDDVSPDGSNNLTAVTGFANNVVDQIPGRVKSKNVIILENDYRSIEDARACKILEEENRNNDLYISYRD